MNHTYGLLYKTVSVQRMVQETSIKEHQCDTHTEDDNVEADNASCIRYFMLMTLLYRDPYISYQTGDGDRIVRNC